MCQGGFSSLRTSISKSCIACRDPQFDVKMTDVLPVHKDAELINQSPDDKQESTTIFYDEKSGIQAIKNIALQLLPVMGEHSMIAGDYEYKR